MSWTLASGLIVVAVQVIIVIGILLVERREPAATMAWLLAVIFVPIAGVLVYLLIGRRRVKRRCVVSLRAAERVRAAASAYLEPLVGAAQDPVSPRTLGLARLAEGSAGHGISHGNRCRILAHASAAYRAMDVAIEEARDHIHVLFYLFQPDETGQAIRDRLARRAAKGVEVRVLVDAVGSHKLTDAFWEPLRQAGGKIAVFGPVNVLWQVRHADRIDHRNHRKLVVVDGTRGFTGGINVGREYLGRDEDVGDWRDTHVSIDGPAVLHLQQVFAGDWCEATGTLIDGERFYPDGASGAAGGESVLIVPSGPDMTWSPIRRMFTHAVAHAERLAWLTSPYFVPDRAMRQTLTSAALRGIDVRLMVPARSDHRLVDLASRASYGELLEAGVRIFEYERGFLHAKTIVVDDWVGVVGSANMDTRSFELNFELSAFVLGTDFTGELVRQFTDDLRHAREVTLRNMLKRGVLKRILMAAARLLSPLL